ncbi:MAG: glycoside hydrolase family protein [Planctomycetota bacterium]|jgi:beta-fructofuranosidase
MYISKGGNICEIGDMDVIVHDNQIHMFYLNVAGHDVVSHIVSSDGMHWERLPNALYTGNPGECDDDQIWTMHTFKHNNKFYMLYTALAQADNGRLQKTALAMSEDLIKWEKVENNPVAAPDPKWYEADLKGCGRADWRDPFIWKEDDTFYALVTAHVKKGSLNRRGCIALLESSDGEKWEVKEPFYSPNISSDWETPAVMKIDEKYYLMGHVCAPPEDYYRIADSFKGPWKRPANDILLPAPNHILFPYKWDDKTLITNWINMTDDYDAVGARVRFIAPPKEVVVRQDKDKTIHLAPYEKAWDSASESDWEYFDLAEGKADNSEWNKKDDILTGTTGSGLGSLLSKKVYTDFEVEAVVSSTDTAKFGIIWRADKGADHYTRASLSLGRKQITLEKCAPRSISGIIGRGQAVLQTNYCPCEFGKDLVLRVAAYGPYIEVSVNNEILLANGTMSRRDGFTGFFAEDGNISIRSAKIRKLQEPEMRLKNGPVK